MQGARHEWRLGRRAIRLVFNRAHIDGCVCQSIDERHRDCFGEYDDTIFGFAETVEIFSGGNSLAVNFKQCRFERRTGSRHHVEAPVSGRHESDALTFTLNNQTDGGTLHTTCGQSTIYFAPQHGGYLITEQAVEDATGLGGVDQAVIETSGSCESMVNGGLGDFVKDHTVYGHTGLDRRLEVFDEVPTDGLTLSVFVGCQIDGTGLLGKGS